MSSSSAPRARRAWTGGVAHGWAEMQRVDDDWWMSLTAAERIELTAELSTSYEWGDDGEAEGTATRLLGARGGVRVRV